MRSSSFTIPLIASLATGGAARADTLLDTHTPTDYEISLAFAHNAAEFAAAAGLSVPPLPPSFIGAGIYVYPTRNVAIGRLSARVRASDSSVPQSGKFVIYQIECNHETSHSSCAPQDIDSGNSGSPTSGPRFESAPVRIPSAAAEGSPSGLATTVVDVSAPGTGLVLAARVVYAIGFLSTDGVDTLWTGDFPLTLDAWQESPMLPKFDDANAPALMTFGRGIVFGPAKESQTLQLQSFTGLPGIVIEAPSTTTTSGGGGGGGGAAGGGAEAPADADRDGVADSQDNCPTVYNPNQANHDHDGSGDACQSAGGCNAGGGAALPLPAALLALALRRRRRGTP